MFEFRQFRLNTVTHMKLWIGSGYTFLLLAIFDHHLGLCKSIDPRVIVLLAPVQARHILDAGTLRIGNIKHLIRDRCYDLVILNKTPEPLIFRELHETALLTNAPAEIHGASRPNGLRCVGSPARVLITSHRAPLVDLIGASQMKDSWFS